MAESSSRARALLWEWIELAAADEERDRAQAHGIDLDAYIRHQFDDSLPDTHQRLGDVSVEWIDGDDPGPIGQLNSEMYLSEGLEPGRNVWWVRVTGRVVDMDEV